MSYEQLSSSIEYLHWFRHSASYINAHRGKTFIIMIDGDSILHPNFKNIIHDIALLHSLGIKLIIIYEANTQINDSFKLSKHEVIFHNNKRIVDRNEIPFVLSAVGTMRIQIEALLSMGLANSPMFGARIDVVSGNIITAKPYGIHDGIDYKLHGEIRSIDVEALESLLKNNNIILLGPIGYSTTGEIFLLKAQDIATEVAIKLQAEKLIFLGKEQGIYNKNNKLIRELYPNNSFEVQHIYLDNSKKAALNGVKRIHVLPFENDGALIQELFTRDGVGTMITDAPYEQVRLANIHDVGGLISLLRPLEEQGILVYRSRERLEQEIDQFVVIERDGTILACAALYPMKAEKNEVLSAELACVAVHPSYRKSNRAVQILNFLEKEAKKMNIEQLFVLTTQTAHWFIEQGFEESDIGDLPSARQALYNYQRKSRVFKKSLKN